MFYLQNVRTGFLVLDWIMCSFKKWIITYTGQPLEMKSLKRKRGDGGEESDEDTNGIAPPINDIYRARQQKRVHTTS